jgi:hypothetical protein
VDETHISEVVLSINATHHKLCLPKLFVIWDMVVRSFTLTNFVDGSITFNRNLNIFEFFSVDRFENKSETFLRNVHGFYIHHSSGEVTRVILANFFKTETFKVSV